VNGVARPLLDRLAGLETEYALRRVTRPDDAGGADNRRFFAALVVALRCRVPLAQAAYLKTGVFLANGGALCYEAVRPSSGFGLIEGATPECRSPRQLLVAQRAQDTLLREAARCAHPSGEFLLLKNCRDSRGHVYGAQENYEVTLAQGCWLAVWRLGMLVLLPVILAVWLLMLAVIVLVLLPLVLLSALAALLLAPLSSHPARLRRRLLGDWSSAEELGLPSWYEALSNGCERLLVLPLACLLWLLMRCVAFRRVRQQLTPFLISRVVLAGSGWLDSRGRFHLAEKAPALNTLLGFGGLLGERGVYSIGHFYKAALVEAWRTPLGYLRLLRPRQRLQIALGDSNMAQQAEYLRVATTMLVLDCIEQGALRGAPRFRWPVRVLHRFAADATLTASARACGGRRWTALEVQRFYLQACRQFVQCHPQPPGEAWEILRLWEETLDALESDRTALVGRIDWVTKQYLLDQVAADAPWEVRKKVDLRYHELSPEGYFSQLEAAGAAVRLLNDDEIEHAIRNPPADSPAAARGRYIREFAVGGAPLKVNWDYVFLPRGGWTLQAIALRRFQRPRTEHSPADGPQHREST
jgi:hypothetical protein